MSNVDVEIIKNYISQKHESEYVDFKEKTYTNLAQSDLSKDVAAFANGVADGDKYIIMGVEDKERKVIGISESYEFDLSSIENYIADKIEPRVTVECGECIVENKRVVYIKIPKTNDNPPYVIKRDSGKNIKQGDIYIRIGTCNRKATREDIDVMYNRNLKTTIRIYERYVRVFTDYSKEEMANNLGDAKIDIELINPTNNPILINGGWVTLTNEFGSIERKAMSFGENRMLEEKPLELRANSRQKKTLQFMFLSDDCLRLRFEDDGKLQYHPNIKVELFDTDGNVYVDEKKSIFLIARGCILHKIQLFYKQFRFGLKNNEKKLVKAVSAKDNETLIKILNSIKSDFSFVQKGYVLGNPYYPEYDVLCKIIRAAKENGNDKAIQILYERGLPVDFVEFALK